MVGGIQAIIYFYLLMTPDSRLSNIDFWLLTVITILIAASGYVINDYYDASIDKINKPQKWIAGNSWSLPTVKNLYISIITIGAIISVYLAIKLNLLTWLFLYPFAIGGLWVYSYKLKCMPFVGNLWVAIFCAAVIAIVAVPDWLFDNKEVIRPELWVYMLFAFMSTLYREIIKDLEDEAGDKIAQCKTFVVRFGLHRGKILALTLGAILLALLLWWDSGLHNNTVHVGMLILQGAIVGSMALLWWAKDHTYFHHASSLVKVVMLIGTGLLLII